ncbi:MAG: adenylosuccinate synthase [Phycisphaerae bacterium]
MKIDLPGNVCVVGLQWGDEGKGKIVNLLTDPGGPAGLFDLVVRYSGGANAGHSVVIGKEKFAMHLVPSGILSPTATAVIANGVVLDPQVVLEEIKTLKSRNVKVAENLKISSKAHVVFPYHKLQDQLSEKQLAGNSLGTTCRGIGPCYADKAYRSYGIRLGELYDKKHFAEKLQRIVADKNKIFQALYGAAELNWKEIYDQFCNYADELKPYVCDTAELLHRNLHQGKRIMFEGAQGALLDLDHGTYPYVTSSNSGPCGLSAGTGVPAALVHSYLGIIKAYTTRVGAGPFPTELKNDIGEGIRVRGKEYGTTTGRPRRTGWFDAVAVKYSIMIGGINSLAVMLLDVLSGLDPIKIAVQYKVDGKPLDFFPTDSHILEKVEIVYEEIPGWTEDITAAKEQNQLPTGAVKYLRRLQELLNCPIKLASVGPERDQTVAIKI